MQRINLRSQGDIYIDQLSTRHNSQQYRQCTYKRNTETLSCSHCCGKAKSVTYYGCLFVALVNQRAKCMRPITLPSVGCLVVPYSFTLSHKQLEFRKLLNIKLCFEIF